jgi:pantoate--beta-alanine ligase
MQVVRTLTELQTARRELVLREYGAKRRRPVVGLTPTLGALHAGHCALIERMCRECDVGLVSIFVNPRQFGPGEDYGRYPRMFEADAALCAAAGVEIVFAPEPGEVYPAGYATRVSVAGLSARWCGAGRPGHFDGVATIVAKLFTLCAPDKAYFGEKDYQQLVIVRRMARDLDLGVEIVPCPTVREADGLALSSRNAYLKPEERAVAPRLYESLREMARRFAQGETDAARLCAAGAAVLDGAGEARFALEYLAIVDPATLEPRDVAQPGDRVLAAAHLGETRLIDNLALPGGQ